MKHMNLDPILNAMTQTTLNGTKSLRIIDIIPIPIMTFQKKKSMKDQSKKLNFYNFSVENLKTDLISKSHVIIASCVVYSAF